MIDPNVFRFLADLAKDPETLRVLGMKSKADVLSESRARGYVFDETTFDATMWDTEIKLAELIGEPFDFSCSMWETMWGKSYLEYLSQVVSPAALAAFHS
jgi:hypothetical protein